MNINKQIVVQKYFDKLRELRDSAIADVEAYKKASNEAPGAMESHSDTSKFQFNLMSDKIAEKVSGFDKLLKYKFDDGAELRGVTGIGSLIQIKEGEREIYYFIVPKGGGGVELLADNATITAISVDSPLGNSLLNKKVGDIVDFVVGLKNRRLEVVSIN